MNEVLTRVREWSGLLTLIVVVIFLALSDNALSSASERKPLRAGYGYLLIHTDVYSKVANWETDSGYVVSSIEIGENAQLVEFKRGTYTWETIRVPYFDLPHIVDFSDKNRWSFTIKPDVINYAGTLVVGEHRSARSVDVRFLNRSTEALEAVRISFPDEFQAYPFVYSGASEDKFLELLADE